MTFVLPSVRTKKRKIGFPDFFIIFKAWVEKSEDFLESLFEYQIFEGYWREDGGGKD